MLLKYGVNPIFSHYLTSQFETIDDVFQRHANRECIITSGNDGKHGTYSIHYELKEYRGTDHVLRKESGAADLRTRDLTDDVVKAICQDLKIKLKGFDVVNEHRKAVHIHIEWDPK